MLSLPNKKVAFSILCLAAVSSLSIVSAADSGPIQTKAVVPEVTGWGYAPKFGIDVTNGSQAATGASTLDVVVTDELTGKSVWEKKVDIHPLSTGETQQLLLQPEFPNGTYQAKWTLTDASGPVAGASGSTPLARMAADVGTLPAGEAQKKYMTNWGIVGGVYWDAPFDLARKTGFNWERMGSRSWWAALEPEPGKINLGFATQDALRDKNWGFGTIYLEPIYTQPTFYPFNEETFAGKYGNILAKESAAFGNNIDVFELGNEDNGTAKFIWSEIARNGAAGARSGSATTMISTTGTASVDINFMRMQQARGLFDRLDALSTHPYTWSSSPEAYNVPSQYDQINQIIDDVGGMKFQFTTEFGYDEKIDQLNRTRWIPRNFALAAAAGLYRGGLFGLYYQFGIYKPNTDPYPSAATLNAYCVATYGHQFAGWFEKSEKAWAAAYDIGGKSVIMAWVPAGTGELQIPVTAGAKALEIRDMFGNVTPTPAVSPDGKSITIPMSESPVYITNLEPAALATAYRHQLESERIRYQRCLAASDLKDVAVWKNLGEGTAPTTSAIRTALLDWKPSETPISLKNQAVVAEALRWLTVAVHADAASGVANADKSGTDTRAKWTARLKSSVAEDVDLPSLRWILHSWNQTRDEVAMLKEVGAAPYATHLASLDLVYDHLADQLADHGQQLFFPIWPYLHAPSGSKNLEERFVFVPGKGVPVKARLQSYSSHSYNGEVSLELPKGWTATPPSWKGKIDAKSLQEVEFSVTAGNEGSTQTITAVLTVPGKPVVRIPFDDFSVLPPLEVKVPVLSKLLPGAPLPLQVVNNGTTPLGAKVRLVEKPQTPALARGSVDSVGAGETKTIELTVPANGKPPAFNEWKLAAEMTTSDGKSFPVPLPIDFDVAVQAKTPPTIDGDLQDWKDAAPLHIDQESYGQGSYGKGWSKEDESGVVYTQWDDKNFYIAAHVLDQTFQQALSGADVWAQDSIQFCLVGPDNVRHMFDMALTPKGSQLWDETKGALVEGGQIKVVVKSGEIIYEAALPWSALPAIKPASGLTFRFDIALNDDDVVVPRRFMERYGVGIVRCTGNDTLGYLRLGDAAPETAVPPQTGAGNPKVVFYENFEEYAPDALPDTWTVVGARTPQVLESYVRTGLGIDGSKCLELNNPLGSQPYLFLTMTRHLNNLIPGKKYRLSAKVKGASVEDTTCILGTSLDELGNVGFNWAPAWKPSDQWQDVTLDWTYGSGDLLVIIRNQVGKIKGLLIDDVTVTEMP